MSLVHEKSGKEVLLEAEEPRILELYGVKVHSTSGCEVHVYVDEECVDCLHPTPKDAFDLCGYYCEAKESIRVEASAPCEITIIYRHGDL
jgi:hypothetical protein